ncbi:hypothetical protein [Glaciibacter sp. 2TAF33]|uniref:hypothetical protein n=1 Tax=Glaciibacter sp. 2TAF33 TaxID=3233015 RepID=UPI003F8E0E72
MQKPLAGIFAVLIAAMLVACTPAGGPDAGGIGNAGATSSSAPSAPSDTPVPTSDEGSLDGVWAVQLADPQSSCIVVTDRLLHIAGGTASISPGVAGLEDGDPELTGPATLDGEAVIIHMQNPAPTKDSIDFSGTRAADGTVLGIAKAGGIHPSLTNGYTCEFAATLVPVAAPTTADCTVAVVQAALNSAPGRTRFVTLQNQATQLVCAGEWALAFAQTDLDTGSPTLEPNLLHAEAGVWEVRDFAAECASRAAPDEVLFACPVG